ncbi:MAG: hypothetical protein GXP60_05590 [Epsilonproteobacteria bacterium]|nr:hypothetical protein [Campylobacterota bacterium]
MKRASIYVLFIAVVFLSLNYSDTYGDSQKNSYTAATVNGYQITEQALKQRINAILPMAFYHSNISEKQKKKIRKEVLDNLINSALFYQEAEKIGLMPAESEIIKRMEKIKRRFKSEKVFDEALKMRGLSKDELRKRIKKNLIIQEFLKKFVETKLAEKQLKDYYIKNRKKFKEPPSVRLRYIRININPADPNGAENALKKAEKALGEIKAGKNFADVASRYSDALTRIMGGETGYVHKGAISDKEVAEAAFSLPIGKVSRIIKTDTAYHILEVEDKRPERQLSFNKVKSKLKKELTRSMENDKYKKLIKRLRAGAKIVIFDK